MRRRSIGLAMVVVGLVGLAGTAWAVVGGSSRSGLSPMMWAARVGGEFTNVTCSAPLLPGQTVDVVVSDMGPGSGGMMGGGRVMAVRASQSSVMAGDVSFRVWNAGMMVHELVVLPLGGRPAGTRTVGSDGRVSEAGSLGEVSRSCGAGAGDGLVPRTEGWMTLRVPAGRYELICNLPGHYGMGMFAELDVR